MTRPPVTFVATVAVLAVGIGVASATLPRAREAALAVPAPAVVSVPAATRVCPDASGTPNRQVTVVASGTSTAAQASPSGSGSQVGSGSGSVTRGPFGSPPVTLTAQPGLAEQRSWSKPAGPIVLSATGPLAPGFEALQVSRADGGAARGLAGTRCVAPGSHFTFVGVGTTVGEDPRLYLTNTEDVAALVDVSVTGVKGGLPSTAGQGLRVAPHQQTVLRLVGLAPDQAHLAVDVTARSGRVAAALRDTRQQGDVPRGVDWVPAAAPAATELVVPGLYQHAAHQELGILDPTDADATVQVQVLRGDGSFVPVGFDQLGVPASTLRTVDVSKALGGQAAALRLVSDHPVQAAVTTTFEGEGGIAETAFTAASGPLADVVVPALPGRTAAGETAGLQLAAPGADARVRVVPLASDGRPAGPASVLTVGSATVRSITADALHAAEPAGVELSVLSGDVYGAMYWYEDGQRGPLATVVPLVTEPRTLTMPGVEPDPLAPLATR